MTSLAYPRASLASRLQCLLREAECMPPHTYMITCATSVESYQPPHMYKTRLYCTTSDGFPAARNGTARTWGMWIWMRCGPRGTRGSPA